MGELQVSLQIESLFMATKLAYWCSLLDSSLIGFLNRPEEVLQIRKSKLVLLKDILFLSQ